MPINALRKDVQRGTCPIPISAPEKESFKSETIDEQVAARDLAAKEVEAMWDEEEGGMVRWSGDQGSRFSDYGA